MSDDLKEKVIQAVRELAAFLPNGDRTTRGGRLIAAVVRAVRELDASELHQGAPQCSMCGDTRTTTLTDGLGGQLTAPCLACQHNAPVPSEPPRPHTALPHGMSTRDWFVRRNAIADIIGLNGVTDVSKRYDVARRVLDIALGVSGDAVRSLSEFDARYLPERAAREALVEGAVPERRDVASERTAEAQPATASAEHADTSSSAKPEPSPVSTSGACEYTKEAGR